MVPGISAICLDRIDLGLKYSILFIERLACLHKCSVESGVTLDRAHRAQCPLLFVEHHISDDQQERHDVRIGRGRFPARRVLKLGSEFRRAVLQDKVVAFTFVLFQHLRPAFVRLIAFHVLLNLELVLPFFKYGFVVSRSERVTF